MKRLVIIMFLVFVCSSFISFSDCSTYTQFKKGSVITQTLYDEKGKPNGTTKSTCMAVTAVGNTTVSTMKNETFDKSGKAENTGEFKITCTAEKIILDIKGMGMIKTQETILMKNSSVSVTGDNIEIPFKLTVGQTLPDAKMKVTFDKKGSSLGSANVQMKNRKVMSKENITTSAGTFSCFKITYEVEMSNMVMKGLKVKQGYKSVTKAQMWYNTENGIIKTIASKETGELVSSMMVTDIKK